MKNFYLAIRIWKRKRKMKKRGRKIKKIYIVKLYSGCVPSPLRRELR